MASEGYCIDLDNEAPMNYTYEPLPTQKSIRLLRLSDVSLRIEGSTIQKLCTIETFAIDSVPPYLTLSYTWGAPLLGEKYTEEYAQSKGWVLASSDPCIDEGGCVVFPDFAMLLIGKNLWFLLRRLCLDPPEIRYIWIDAVCIDQSNLHERASQVSMMTDIYARCTSSIIWLGDCAESGADLGRFYDLHVELCDAINAYLAERGPGNIGDGWTRYNFHTRLKLEHVEDKLDWRGYAQFFRERTWFTRAWIMQEIYFTPDAVFMFANLLPDLELLTRVAQFLRVTGLASQLTRFDEWEDIDSNSEEAPENSGIRMTPGAWLENMHNARQQMIGIGTLSWLDNVARKLDSGSLKIAAYTFWAYSLGQLRHLNATDKRDKVFATFGFIQTALQPLKLVPDCRIIPDYTKSLAQVYEDTMRVLLMETADLSILSEVQDPSTTLLHGLPSWVPDFSATLHQSLFHSGRYSRYNASTCAVPRGKPTSVRFNLSLSPLLILRGSSVDIIKVAQTPNARNTSISASLSILEFRKKEIVGWRDLLDHANAYDLRSKWRALFHTLLARHQDGIEALPVTAKQFKAYMTEYIYALHQTSNHSERTRVDDEVWRMFPDINHANSANQDILPSKQEIQAFISLYEHCLEHRQDMTEADLAFVNNTATDARHFENVMGKYGINRRLFVTHEGRLGLGPRSVQEGDEVWLVQEARMLFTVRPMAAGEYQLIGETYMYGCMDGELVGQAEEKGWVDLKLR
ncbi:Nn.00g087170.m01.CDS01 [Neocucurbitaria sp. VM-36]